MTDSGGERSPAPDRGSQTGVGRAEAPRGVSRRGLVGVLGVAAVGTVAYLSRDYWWPEGLVVPIPGLYEVSREERPNFTMPFACGEQWRLTTYANHNPDDMKLDMYRVDGQTQGAVVRASAPGRVHQLVHPGGVKIHHGHGWYTLSLHMEPVTVEVGQELQRGDPIGEVGAVATSVAHLHYEQLFDADGKGNARPRDMVHPIVQGTEYRLHPDDEFPVVTSETGC